MKGNKSGGFGLTQKRRSPSN